MSGRPGPDSRKRRRPDAAAKPCVTSGRPPGTQLETVMGIFGALTTAVHRGCVHSPSRSRTCPANIANSQTDRIQADGLRASRISFPTGNRPHQLAGSVTANSRETNTVQGDISGSSIGTFMAINGQGFFVVEKPSSVVDNRPVFSGVENFTRRGDFQPDKNGFLVNGAGYFLMGIPIDATTGNPRRQRAAGPCSSRTIFFRPRPRPRSTITPIWRAIRSPRRTIPAYRARNC